MIDTDRLAPAIRRLRPALDPLDSLPASTFPGRRAAAVLVLLFESEHGLSTVLTSRPQTMARHPGQIALPGGAAEASDGSPAETALREFREELGSDTSGFAVLGTLAAVDVAASGYRIVPVVAATREQPAWRPDRREVARVMIQPLRELAAPGAIVEERWRMRDAEWRVSLFRVSGLAIWGATARILGDLLGRFDTSLDATDIGSVRPWA